MNIKTGLFFIASLILLASCTGRHQEYDILNENFDSNKIGWVEESTEAHKTEIVNGFLYIYSIDTSKERSSDGPQNISFLWNFPKSYEITSSIECIESNDKARYGILLQSGSLTYTFSFSDSSIAKVSEYDYNRDSEIPLFSKKMEAVSGAIAFKIIVADKKFEFFINDQSIGQAKFKTKTWEDIRLFTTTGSAVKVDYLRIKKDE